MKMIKKLLWLPMVIFFTGPTFGTERDSTEYLQPTAAHIKESKIIVQILDYFHYRETDLDDSLSSVIFNNFIETLDGNKSYFLESDIKSFEKYRYELDNRSKEGDLIPAFYIFNIYKKRVDARLEYALAHVTDKFDFDKKESLAFDREKEPYAKNVAELDEIWRKTIKNQALQLKLSGSEYDKIVDVLTKRYERFQSNVSKYNSNDVFEMFMNSVTEAFDPHTNYFTPLNAEDFQMQSSKSLEGIGATLQQDNDFTKITELRPGGPAFLSGEIQAEDRVTGVAQGADGEMIDVVGWRSDEVAGQIRGPKGTLVRLQLLPAGASPGSEMKEVMLVRDKIKLDESRAKSKVVKYTEGGIDYNFGIITVPDFYLDPEGYDQGGEDYTSTTNDVRKIIKELEAENVDGIMLDLRNNGGGQLVEAISLSGLFLPGGTVVQVKDSRAQIQKYDDENKGMTYEGPMNVMINRFSASASEIFAGAIQDYKRGVIVGEQSYGKGTVQNVRGLEDFLRQKSEDKLGLLKFTIAKFYRVTGSSTQHKGVTPDIEYPSVYSADEFGESSKPSALPWDKIASADFKTLDYVDQNMLSMLEKRHKQRLKEDQTLIDLQEDISELRKNRARKYISLNYDERKKEQDDFEKRKRDRELKATVRIGDSLDDASSSNGRSLADMKDAYLKESIKLLADQIVIKKKRG
ncbi:carboxy terminal-processing peptidase [Roseivirga misakiensis]|uniref:Tail-specific protease n=1 Tax=Roseivirga misakiensis TaxID=1563681 RepID=A0A1E5T5S4_9BACT|nr:carboxy terminal-processing peptidase [Roseivirga misakiensis]OEK06657.1 hypothetical protein BFP71_03045 [Roseivirga misakiensis]